MSVLRSTTTAMDGRALSTAVTAMALLSRANGRAVRGRGKVDRVPRNGGTFSQVFRFDNSWIGHRDGDGASPCRGQQAAGDRRQWVRRAGGVPRGGAEGIFGDIAFPPRCSIRTGLTPLQSRLACVEIAVNLSSRRSFTHWRRALCCRCWKLPGH